LVAPRHSNEIIAALTVYGSSSKRSEQFAHVTGYAGGKLRETVERQAKLLRDFNQNALYFGKGLGTRRKWSQVEALALFNALGLAVDILSSLLLGLCGSLPPGLTGALSTSFSQNRPRWRSAGLLELSMRATINIIKSIRSKNACPCGVNWNTI
jgi:hypothetical protein